PSARPRRDGPAGAAAEAGADRARAGAAGGAPAQSRRPQYAPQGRRRTTPARSAPRRRREPVVISVRRRRIWTPTVTAATAAATAAAWKSSHGNGTPAMTGPNTEVPADITIMAR